ncbi:MAG: GreA/GreB family elongation factor [Rudaea sp.]
MENQTELTVTLGAHVEVDLLDKKGTRERLAFDIVADREADFAAGRLSENAPLARALAGKRAGDSVPYNVGDLVEARVLSVGESRRRPSEDAAAEREEKLRRARSQAELGNVISFALTFDSKWGDYDPESIAENWDEDRPPPADEPEKKE